MKAVDARNTGPLDLIDYSAAVTYGERGSLYCLISKRRDRFFSRACETFGTGTILANSNSAHIFPIPLISQENRSSQFFFINN